MSDRPDSIMDILQPQSQVNQVDTVEAVGEPATADDYVAFGHGRVGRRPQMMIAFRKCSGHIEVFPYSLLRRIQSDDPDRGFSLSFGETELVITGRGLGQLFRYVCEHRAVEMIEADRTEALGGEDCLVTRMVVRGD